MKFSQKLENLKEAQNISNYRIAKYLECSQSTVANWLNDKNVPSLDIVEKLSKLFSVPPSYFSDNDNIKVYDEHDNIVVIDDETRDIIDTLRTNPEMKILFSVSKKATKEDILKAVKIIEALKGDE